MQRVDKKTGRFLKIPLEQRFLEKVNKKCKNGCWEWQGYRDKDGYGQSSIEPSRSIPAHRVSWYLYYNEYPKEKWVLHNCDNPPCVNPEHLYLGDAQDNARDRDERGRSIKGEGVNTNILKERQVKLIRKINKKYGLAPKLANYYGVDQSTIHDIWNHRSWKHI